MRQFQVTWKINGKPHKSVVTAIKQKAESEFAYLQLEAVGNKSAIGHQSVTMTEIIEHLNSKGRGLRTVTTTEYLT